VPLAKFIHEALDVRNYHDGNLWDLGNWFSFFLRMIIWLSSFDRWWHYIMWDIINQVLRKCLFLNRWPSEEFVIMFVVLRWIFFLNKFSVLVSQSNLSFKWNNAISLYYHRNYHFFCFHLSRFSQVMKYTIRLKRGTISCDGICKGNYYNINYIFSFFDIYGVSPQKKLT
jgi:hypothetical protein